MDPSLLAQLHEALQLTDLSCQTLIDLGESFHNRTRNDVATADIFAVAVEVGHKQLSDGKLDQTARRALIIKMNRGRGILWRVVDQGHNQFIAPLRLLSGDLADGIALDDKELAADREKGIVGVMECMSLSGDKAGALKACEDIDTDSLSAKMKQSVIWDHGLLLYRAGRYADAIPLLRIAAGSGSHRPQAAQLMLQAAERSNDNGAVEDARVLLESTKDSGGQP